MIRDTFFITLFFVLVGVAVLYILDSFFFFLLSSKIWWYDVVTHFGGGFWAGGLVLWGYTYINKTSHTENSRTSLLLLSILAALTIGILWELYEVILLPTLSSAPDYVFDTTTDLIADVCGASLAGFYFFYIRTHTVFSHKQE
ncbi:MAG: hypothetical protein Q8R36_05355 [bacterium]|nr:hypothetical protein [bacterium]